MNPIFAHIFRALPAKYLNRAIIAGGAAACYEKADDIDVWVLGLNDDKKVEQFKADLRTAGISNIEFVDDSEVIGKKTDSGANWNNQVIANVPIGIPLPNPDIFAMDDFTKPVQIMASVFMDAQSLLEDFDLSIHAIGYNCVGTIFKAKNWTNLEDSPKLIADPKSPDRTLSRYRRFCLRYRLAPDLQILKRLCEMPDPEPLH